MGDFLRIKKSNGESQDQYICIENTISTVKPVSIPRFELLEAVLGLRLTIKIARAADLSISDVRLWCESMKYECPSLDSWSLP